MAHAPLGDARYALRMLARQPGFSAIVVLTLALGVAANVAIFAILNGLVIRPLPYPDTGRLAAVLEIAARSSGRPLGVSYPDFVDWRTRAGAFEAVGAIEAQGFALRVDGQAEAIGGARVSASTFRVFGLNALVGRVFTDGEENGDQRVAVLGYLAWRDRFNASHTVIGQAVRLDGQPYTVIGVMPAEFQYPATAQVWVPLAAGATGKDRGVRTLEVVARLKPDKTLAQARTELKAIGAALEREYPGTNKDVAVRLLSLDDVMRPRPFAFMLTVCLAAAGFVLLIAVANVSSLMLVRGAGRARELAVRRTLGATRWRIFRLLFLESLILAAPGAALGLLLGIWGRDVMLAVVPFEIPLWMRFGIDWRVAAFTCALALLSASACGLGPALRAARRAPGADLGDAARSTERPRGVRLRTVSVVGQIALTLVLLVGAGLMIRTFANIVRVDPGFRADGVLTLHVSLPSNRYPEEQQRQFWAALEERLGSLPGVSSVALTSAVPMADEGGGARYELDEAVGEQTSEQVAVFRAVSPGFFRTAGIPLLQGRPFEAGDIRTAMPAAIVTRTFAARHWRAASPMGRRIRLRVRGADSGWLTIVGVAGDIQHWRLDGELRPTVYVPLAQFPQPSIGVMLRTASAPLALADAARRGVSGLDRDLPVVGVATLETAIQRSLWAARLFTGLFEVLGATALLLAVVGIYGVTSYAVARRTHEIGIRMALGADARAVASLVVGHGVRMAVAGVALGVAGAFALTRTLVSVLFGVTPHDLWTFAAACTLLVSVALVAAYLPARRALSMNPLDALRQD